MKTMVQGAVLLIALIIGCVSPPCVVMVNYANKFVPVAMAHTEEIIGVANKQACRVAHNQRR